ncbi:MBOAT family O-acyltransferase [Magnetococcus sp. PR-3]|uniref:MBOAT family O-acyltransferase n=1 Tax=Magnetococcus sp. PR-3 TaxID=3120355 RepID=UPI002FCE4D0B
MLLVRFSTQYWTFMGLTLASLFFYGSWKPIYLLLIGGSILFNYAMGLAIKRHEHDPGRRLWLKLGVVANLSVLFVFKYLGFSVSQIYALVDWQGHIPAIELPLAISFFTFQQIAYLIDIYKREPAQANLAEYALFVAFFPQLIAGPIVHHSEIVWQFERLKERFITLNNLTIGMTVFIIGMFKKVVLADGMASYADPIFNAADKGTMISTVDAWVGTLAYTFQIYFDFSGYSEMAIGLAWMFGIRLPNNFNSPYKATSIIDFWRRWHMTLSRFLRDYLYIPLGGNRHGPLMKYRNMFLTMLLGGLWHGAGWTFVIWGALHGLYLTLNHFWQAWAPVQKSFWHNRITAQLLTFLAVIIAWVFFRATTFEGASQIMTGMFQWQTSIQNLTDQPLMAAVWLSLCLAIVWKLPNTIQFMSHALPELSSSGKALVMKPVEHRFYWQQNGWFALLIGSMFAMALLKTMAKVPSAFIYFQF